MKLLHPYMLYLAWVVVLLFGVTVYGIRKRKRILLKFASGEVFKTVVPDYQGKKPWIRGMVMIAGLLFLCMALAGPQWGFRWEMVEEKGVDIMIALDCSRSMLAQDIKPSRLERAKHEIIDLLRMMESDRAGLVAFSGSAVLQCPLTLDHEAFNIFLKALEPDFLPVGGTDLAGAVQTAMSGFETKIDSEKAIILITDGENTTGEPLEAAKIAAEAGIKLFCIGVGKEEGAPVPDKAGGFKKDDSGSIVLSRVDDEGLRKIAAMGRGIYVKSVAGDMDLDRIYQGEIKSKMEQKTLKSGRRKVWENRFQWFLFPALVLLLAELFISDRKKPAAGYLKSAPRQANKNRARLLNLFLPLLFLMLLCDNHQVMAGASKSVEKGVEAYGSGDFETAEKLFIDAQLKRPEMAELYYNIGTAAYKKGDYESALRNFTRAMESGDTEVKPKAGFNIGNTQFRLGKLDAAAEAFQKILDLNPEDIQAAENLAFVQKKIEEEKNKPPPDPNQDPNQDPDQDQDKEDKEDKEKNREDQDKDGQDKEKQDQEKQDQEKKDQEKKDQQNQDQQKSDKKQPEQEERDKQGGGDKKPPPPKPDGDDKQSMQPPGQAGQGKPPDKDDPDSEQAKALERMLNRLEDKPGKAMMPVYEGRGVEKDW